eukprot:GEMP01014116.1.p1 GENE.GEMP01014116.1~~GEMP01014116.1.p1  ORF type:complete len:771 (+),score=121.55 GEMP01014116.1:233-2545(+)
MVQFGRSLLERRQAEWGPYYVNYDELKEILRLLLDEQGMEEMAELNGIFLKQLDFEIDKAAVFYEYQLQLCNSMLVELGSLADTYHSEYTALGLFQCYQHLADELQHVMEFVELNCEAIRKVLKKHDKKLSLRGVGGLGCKDDFVRSRLLPGSISKLDTLQVPQAINAMMTEVQEHMETIKSMTEAAPHAAVCDTTMDARRSPDLQNYKRRLKQLKHSAFQAIRRRRFFYKLKDEATETAISERMRYKAFLKVGVCLSFFNEGFFWMYFTRPMFSADRLPYTGLFLIAGGLLCRIIPLFIDYRTKKWGFFAGAITAATGNTLLAMLYSVDDVPIWIIAVARICTACGVPLIDDSSGGYDGIFLGLGALVFSSFHHTALEQQIAFIAIAISYLMWAFVCLRWYTDMPTFAPTSIRWADNVGGTTTRQPLLGNTAVNTKKCDDLMACLCACTIVFVACAVPTFVGLFGLLSIKDNYFGLALTVAGVATMVIGPGDPKRWNFRWTTASWTFLSLAVATLGIFGCSDVQQFLKHAPSFTDQRFWVSFVLVATACEVLLSSSSAIALSLGPPRYVMAPLCLGRGLGALSVGLLWYYDCIKLNVSLLVTGALLIVALLFGLFVSSTRLMEGLSDIKRNVALRGLHGVVNFQSNVSRYSPVQYSNSIASSRRHECQNSGAISGGAIKNILARSVTPRKPYESPPRSSTPQGSLHLSVDGDMRRRSDVATSDTGSIETNRLRLPEPALNSGGPPLGVPSCVESRIRFFDASSIYICYI